MSFFTDTSYQVVDGNIVYAADLNNPLAALENGIASLVTAIQTGDAILSAVDTGVINAYVMSLTEAPTSLADGQEVWLVPTITNDGPATLNLNDLGAKAIRTIDRTALIGGELLSGYPFKLKYIEAVDSFMIVSTPGSTAVDGTKSLVAGNGMGLTIGDDTIIVAAKRDLNYIIDGDFENWFEGTSQTSSGYGSDVMCSNTHSGSTKTHSRQTFTLGQTDVPGGVKYYSRTAVTSSAGAGNFCSKIFFIDDVRRLAGKTVTLSFYAKADDVKNIAAEFGQSFGTGGSPSTSVTGVGQLVSLTTAWAKRTLSFDIPGIAGKTIGSNEDSRTYLRLWFDAGSSFDVRSASLGQQSGTFDIARVRLVEGGIDGDSIDLDPGYELRRINELWETGRATHSYRNAGASGITALYTMCSFVIPKRRVPTVTLNGWSYYSSGSSTDCTPTVPTAYTDSFRVQATGLSNANGFNNGTWVADCRPGA